MGLIDSFSSAYNSYTVKAGEMGLVSFERIFLIDYKACIIFKNRPSTNDTVRTQNISEMVKCTRFLPNRYIELAKSLRTV